MCTVKLSYCFSCFGDVTSSLMKLMNTIMLDPSGLVFTPLFPPFRHQLPTAWSQSLWEWTALCQEGCPPLWPSMLWPIRYDTTSSVTSVRFYQWLRSHVVTQVLGSAHMLGKLFPVSHFLHLMIHWYYNSEVVENSSQRHCFVPIYVLWILMY